MTQETNVEHTSEECDYGSRLETMQLKRIELKKKEHSLIYKIAAGMAAAVVLVAGVGIYATHKNVTVHYGDHNVAVSTWHKTPEAVVAQAGMHLADNTRIADESKSVSDGDSIVIEKAKKVTVEKDGKMEQVFTFASSAEELLKELPSVSAVAIAGADARSMPVVSAKKTIQVNVDGTTKKVEIGENQTVREAIEAAGIQTSPLDRVIATDTPVSQKGTAKGVKSTSVKIQRVQRVVNEEKIKVKRSVDEQKDNSLYKGQTRVVEEGRDGLRVKRTFVEKVDGKEVYSKQLEDKVVTEAKTRVVKVGTKTPPAPSVAPSSGGGGAHYAGDGVWGALAQCESGGNPRAVGGGGLYYGLYQFSPQTWQSVGGSGLPSEASPEEQTKRAKILQQRSGWGQWPACSASIGVR